MDNIEPISISLDTSNKGVLELICFVPIVFCDIGGQVNSQHVPCQIIKNLQYDIIL